MTLPVAPVPLSALIAVECAWCHCFPCVCARTSECACGGTVLALADVFQAMRDHQQTARHQAWRERCGL